MALLLPSSATRKSPILEAATEAVPRYVSIPSTFLSIDQQEKGRILQKLEEAAEQKQYWRCPSFWEIFRGQLKYISGFCLGGQLNTESLLPAASPEDAPSAAAL